MAIKELNVDLSAHRVRLSVLGRKELLSQAVEGNWATVFKGRGLEFTGYREYTYSDDASLIDWKASLRSKDVLVREFEEFKNFKVMFVLDVSNTMLFSTVEKLKAEYGAELLYALSEAASHSGDAVGLAMFSDNVLASFQPEFGHGIRLKFERLLTDADNYGGERRLKQSLLEVNSMLPNPSIIVLISDFLGYPDDWERYIAFLSTRHQVIGIMVKDKRDRELPRHGGQFAVKDPNSNETMYIDTRQYAREYSQLTKEHEERVMKTFKRFRSNCMLIENGTPYDEALHRFFNDFKHNLT